MFYNDAKKKSIKRLKNVEVEYNDVARKANEKILELYQTRKLAANAIERVQEYLKVLANTPKEFRKDVQTVSENIREFKEAVRVEEENAANNVKGVGTAMGGIFAGGTIAAMGPTAAMAVATTFGVASTGTPIAALSGAAATNAALAWLGGGAAAAGGGGMAAGNAFLALAGPVGWGVAAALAVGGGLFAAFKNKKAAEEADRICRDVRKKLSALRPKLVNLESLCENTISLKSTLDLAPFLIFPKDYHEFNDSQKKALASLINNTVSMGKMINERIA